ncbi:hypothetical protein MMAD_06890 [Mycolicibacterium madagascariense]|uniref:Uncharacterized protein n=1 Tax=Mycolicibacterium madagascariense TaxID=212765 RepID=A0A7I7X9Y9_9MYCO|nr:hypothetical protein MMAD_06890 [Mycolicibacterium madagascariense]
MNDVVVSVLGEVPDVVVALVSPGLMSEVIGGLVLVIVSVLVAVVVVVVPESLDCTEYCGVGGGGASDPLVT